MAHQRWEFVCDYWTHADTAPPLKPGKEEARKGGP